MRALSVKISIPLYCNSRYAVSITYRPRGPAQLRRLNRGTGPRPQWIQLSAKSCDFGDGDEPCCGSRPVSVAAQIRADCTATVKTTPGASATASDTALDIAKCVDSQRSNATKLTAARDVAYHQAYPRCPQYGQTPTCNVIFDSW